MADFPQGSSGMLFSYVIDEAHLQRPHEPYWDLVFSKSMNDIQSGETALLSPIIGWYRYGDDQVDPVVGIPIDQPLSPSQFREQVYSVVSARK